MALIKCKECGKEISDKADHCPHCGYKNPVEQQITEVRQNAFPPEQSANQQQYQNQQYQNQQNYNNGNAETGNNAKNGVFGILGFVLSIVSLFLALWGTVAITALIFSIIGVVSNSQSKNKMKGFAISGIILSSISLLYTLFQFLTF